jgi:hypothetical protein
MDRLAESCLLPLLNRLKRRSCQQPTEPQQSVRVYGRVESKPTMIPRLLDKVPRAAGAARHIWIQQLAGYWTAMQRGLMTKTGRLSRHTLRNPVTLLVFCTVWLGQAVKGSHISEREGCKLAVQSEVASHCSVLRDDQELLLIRPA